MTIGKHTAQELKSRIGVLIVLLLVVALVYVVAEKPQPFIQHTPASLGEQIRTGNAGAPFFSSGVAERLQASGGFEHIIMYTDAGFEPAHLLVQRGETIRFSNISSNDVWIAASGERVQIYPRTREVCGSSDLDSCRPFPPQDFWEFTFERPGEWEVVNNLDKSKSGVVFVK